MFPTFGWVTLTRTGPRFSIWRNEWSPPLRCRPQGGSSVISTSATRQLVEGSHPGKGIPAVLRTRLRPPSQPTRYDARSAGPADRVDVDAGVVLSETSDLLAVVDWHAQLADPVGEDALMRCCSSPSP